MPAFENALIREKSPYLLQHAHNPVNWLPWGKEALEKAVREDKPVFLSIGYATCHWCHVMEKESFEDENVASLINDTFVPIKVDREERPDLDGVYMAACQLMNKSGGWPLNVFLTPEGKPFFAGTYMPKHSRGQMPGLMEMIPRVKFLWKTQRDSITASAESILSGLQNGAVMTVGELPSQGTIEKVLNHFDSNYDRSWGGFYEAPKFPMPGILLFLLGLLERGQEGHILEMTVNTLEKMSLGGMMDHLGGGFHRYSTDRKWILPHFEKMLYDQAQLLLLYTKGWEVAQREDFLDVAKGIIEYVRRDMTSPEGPFFTAEDADSEGEEGKFYLWSLEEIRDLLPHDWQLFSAVFNLREDGNFMEEASGKRTGTNILYPGKPLSLIAEELNVPCDRLKTMIEEWRKILLAQRDGRVRPLRDDKILTDWNGLMIASLAYAGRVLDEAEPVAMASGAADFILEKMIDHEGRLYHRYREGERAIEAFLDDHSFLSWGLFELYRSTGKEHYLRKTETLISGMIDRFWDRDNWGFFFTPEGQEDLLFRRKEAYDGAILSGNAVAAHVLAQMGHITGKEVHRDRAGQVLRAFSSIITGIPASHTSMLKVMMDLQGD